MIGPCTGRRWPLALALVASLLTACRQRGPEPTGRAPDAATTAPEPVDEGLVVETLRARFPELVRQYEAEAEPLASHLAASLGGSPEDELGEVLREVYGSDPVARFVAPDGALTGLGGCVLRRVEASKAEALDPSKFGADEARAAVEAARESAARLAGVELPTLPGSLRLEELVERYHLGSMGAEAGAKRLVGLLGADGSPSERVRAGLGAHREAFVAARRAWAAAELSVARTFLRFAKAMLPGRVSRVSWDQDYRAKRYRKALERAKEKAKARKPGDPEVELPEPPPEPKTMRELWHEALVRAITGLPEVQAVEPEGGCARVWAGLEPPGDQYRKLVSELARYRDIAKAGGWKKLRWRPRYVGRGSSKKLIEALEARLAAEGYFHGEVDGRYDKDLRKAIRLYHRTHQLMLRKELSRSFWKSLNVPVQSRIRRIELTLQRWRESRIDGDTTYVFVNIADFAAEVWKDGERVFRTGIVVGNREKRCDEETKREVLGYATPIQSAYITYLVFAPHWRVPPRIKREELDLEREKDPLFYQKEGYELLDPGTPREVARQLPGPSNSLGFVKIIFPNEYSVFMHDTPAKNLFIYPVRTFSHGCMRLEKPLEMAKAILTIDGKWDEEKFQELHEKWEEIDFSPLEELEDDPERFEEAYEELRRQASDLEETVVLRHPIPIHVEYYTVRVDDDGWANFLADPYGYDRLRLHPELEQEECKPDSEVALEAFGGTPQALDELEARMEALEPKIRTTVETALALEDSGGRWVTRAKDRAKGLQRKLTGSMNLAEQIRTLYEDLDEALQDEGGWNKRRTRRAIKLKRMMDELGKMVARLDKGLKKLGSLLEAHHVEVGAGGGGRGAETDEGSQ